MLKMGDTYDARTPEGGREDRFQKGYGKLIPFPGPHTHKRPRRRFSQARTTVTAEQSAAPRLALVLGHRSSVPADQIPPGIGREGRAEPSRSRIIDATANALRDIPAPKWRDDREDDRDDDRDDPPRFLRRSLRLPLVIAIGLYVAVLGLIARGLAAQLSWGGSLLVIGGVHLFAATLTYSRNGTPMRSAESRRLD